MKHLNRYPRNTPSAHLLKGLSLFCLPLLCLPQSGLSTPGAFQQDSMSQGVVVIEAEHYTGRLATETHSWEQSVLPSGTVVMKGLPDGDGFKQNSGFVGTTARMDFLVNFNQTGVHYIAVRGYGESYRSDSLHMGLNGAFVETADRVFVGRNNLTWSQETIDDVVASVVIDSVGEHTVNVWMRESGFMLDKILLSKAEHFVPHGDGPPESPREGVDQTVNERNVRETEIFDLHLDGTMLAGEFMPAPATEQYQVFFRPDLHSDPVPAGNAVTFGYELLLDPANAGQGFFSIEAVPVEAEREQCGLVLSRLAYGPTPDLLDRVMNGSSPLGADGYIQEQLHPELLTETADERLEIQVLRDRLRSQSAEVEDLQAWHSLRAVHADRQLLEVLGQFVNNHFVTYVWKVRSWLRDEGLDSDEAEGFAAQMEYDEMEAWKSILRDPDGTFLDLLKVSIESPSMIIYLDTVLNGKEDPNENFGRELLELFCMGVDNGYDQDDLEEMARIWTGWRLGQAHPDDQAATPVPYTQALLLPEGSPSWKYRKGETAPESNWNEISYDDTGVEWVTAQTGIGYGDGDDTTVIDDMRYNYSSLYFRHDLTIPDAAAVSELTLRIFIDDGYVAYLNGTEIGRHNLGLPGDPHPHDVFADDYEGDGVWTTILIDNDAQNLLVDGKNVLAVHGFQASLGSSDFSFDVEILEGPKPVYRAVFDPAEHDEDDKVLFEGKMTDPRFGAPFANQSYELVVQGGVGSDGQLEGYTAVEHLANLPYTMEFISTKLCRLFVHENFELGTYYNISGLSPEAELVRACMLAWNTPAADGRKGNIRQVLSVIFSSDLFRSQSAANQKVKTPFEFSVSAIRALRADLGGGQLAANTDGFDLSRPMDYMGMELFARNEPNGWPEDGEEWIDSGTLVERMRFIQNLMVPSADPLKEEDLGSSQTENRCDPVALLQAKIASVDLASAGVVSDYFLGVFFPAEGTANLVLEREECLRLLNSDDFGTVDASPLSGLSVDSEAYDKRIRSLVSLLLCSPKFQEQ